MEERTGQNTSDRAERERRSRALERFERRLVEGRLVPDAERVVARRFAGVLQGLTAVALGIVVGHGSILVNFLLFNKLLHLF